MVSDRISSLASKLGESFRSRLGAGRRGNPSENIHQDGTVEGEEEHHATLHSPEHEEEGEEGRQYGASFPPSSKQEVIDAVEEDNDSHVDHKRTVVEERPGPHKAPELVAKAASDAVLEEEGEVEKPEPSRETDYLYIQTSRVARSGGFRRVTLEEFLRSRQIEEEVEKARAAGSKSLTLRSFDDVRTARSIQNAFHKFALVISGLLAGIAVGHAFIAFILDRLALAEEYRWMAVPTQSIFFAGFVICLLDAFDRLEVEGSAKDAIRRVLRRGGGLSVLIALLAAICTLLMTPYDEVFDGGNAEQLDPNAFRMWRLLSAARAVASVLSWVLLAAHASLPYNFMNAYLAN